MLYFADRLREQSMRRDAFVVNRVHPEYGEVPGAAEVEAAIDARHLHLGDGAAERLRHAAEDETRLGRMDKIHLMALDGALEDETSGGSLAVRACRRSRTTSTRLAAARPECAELLAPG